MSAFLGTAGFTGSQTMMRPGWGQNNDIINPVQYRRSAPGTYGGSWPEMTTDARWPRSQILGGSNIGTAADQEWEWNTPFTGSHVLKVISGFVYDVGNNPVSGATVMLFNTATGALVDTQTSAVDGSYKVSDPNAVACFVVVYKSGSPDVAGTSLDTVLGV